VSDLRKAAEAVLERWDSPAWEWIKQGPTAELMATLRAALAAPRPEPEKERAEVAAPARSGVAQTEEIDSFTPEAYHEKRHPGYVIGSHWFETAYERLCAGEAEDAILEDYELAREPRLRDLRRDAERIGWLERNGIGCEKVGNIGFFVWRNGTRYAGDTPRAAIDAAMEDKTCAAIDAAMQEDRS
jgi:hypothetical protein